MGSTVPASAWVQAIRTIVGFSPLLGAGTEAPLAAWRWGERGELVGDWSAGEEFSLGTPSWLEYFNRTIALG